MAARHREYWNHNATYHRWLLAIAANIAATSSMSVVVTAFSLSGSRRCRGR
jgi:hypothetical protein